jgi:integrase
VLAWEDIQKTIRAVDSASVKDRRNRALLLILATYGMRIGQIRALRLDDLDWRAGTIRFHGVKGGRDVVLPLTTEVGEALVAWLQVRPRVAFREVFLRLRAPIRPLRSNLYPLIERYARKAGVTAPIVGARTWRHGRATRMLERGVSLKTIRDMLGHRSIDSTFIYTKVDLPMLRQAALEWPGGEP